MKRTPLKRTKGLSRSKPPVKATPTARPWPSPRSRQRAVERARERAAEPGRDDWQRRRTGRCAVCGVRGPIVLHHVIPEQEVRRRGGDPWDQRNALPVGAPPPWGGRCTCHGDHHSGGDGRIVVQKLSAANLEFARELLGAYADDYFARYYRRATTKGDTPCPSPS